MASATVRPGVPVWLADSSGIGHARVNPKDWNAACGRRLVLERLSHPVRERCLVCLSVTGIDVTLRAPR